MEKEGSIDKAQEVITDAAKSVNGAKTTAEGVGTLAEAAALTVTKALTESLARTVRRARELVVKKDKPKRSRTTGRKAKKRAGRAAKKGTRKTAAGRNTVRKRRQAAAKASGRNSRKSAKIVRRKAAGRTRAKARDR